MATDLNKANISEENKLATALVEVLNWSYDKIAGGVENPPVTEGEIDRRIAFYCTMAGAAGFAANMGGIITLPVAIPANLFGTAALQLRLIAEIAAGRKYPIHTIEVRSMALACLVGGAALEVIKEAGVQIGVQAGKQVIAGIAGSALTQINRSVGFRLVTKAGSQGVVNLTKVVPVIGGVIGGSVDALSTKAVGEVARKVFGPLHNRSSEGPTNLVSVPKVPSFFVHASS